MALGGISLSDALRAESASVSGHSHKSIINIYLPGGPPHLDMWDPKPLAPVEIRGEFQSIQTNVPGIEVSEMFPRMAQMMGGGDMSKLKAMGAPGAAPDPQALEQMAAKLGGKLPGFGGGHGQLPGLGGGLPPGFNPFKK